MANQHQNSKYKKQTSETLKGTELYNMAVKLYSDESDLTLLKEHSAEIKQKIRTLAQKIYSDTVKLKERCLKH